MSKRPAPTTAAGIARRFTAEIGKVVAYVGADGAVRITTPPTPVMTGGLADRMRLCKVWARKLGYRATWDRTATYPTLRVVPIAVR